MFAKRAGWAWWILAAPALLILPRLGDYFYPAASRFSDLTISHAPNAVFLLRALLVEHVVPLWSPAIMSGYPFAGDPLAGLWYPPGWLALLFPPPVGFNLAYLAHMLWGGIGLAVWLRRKGLRLPAAAVGGLAFELLPKAAAHFAAGHISLVYALAWTPWLLWAEEARHPLEPGRAVSAAPRRLLPGRLLPGRLLPGVILGVILLADPRWAAYSGALWLAYRWFGGPAAGAAGGDAGAGKNWGRAGGIRAAGRELLRDLPQVLVNALLAAALAAPLLAPLVEFTRLSTRAEMTPADFNAMALPPARFLGLVFPDAQGNAEWVVYAGGVVFLLAVSCLFAADVRRRAGFWLWAAAAACVLAPGLPGPLGEAARLLPGVNLLRVPARGMLLAGFSAAVLAAYLIDRVSRLAENGARPAKGGSRALNLFLAGFAALTALLAGGVWAVSGQLPLAFAWGTAAVLAGALWVGLGLRGRLPAGTAVWIAAALIAADSGGIDLQLASTRAPAEVLQEGAQAAEFIASQPGTFRVYSPSYSLPQLTAAVYGLELADGIDPLQLRAYTDFFQKASGAAETGYSVTLPAFPTGDPRSDNRGIVPDTRLLGLLNVRYVAAEFDLDAPALKLVGRFGETRVYQNLDELPRGWVQTGETVNLSAVRGVLFRSRGANRAAVAAEGPGLLVLSEAAYPGWEARVDGAPAQIRVVDGVLRGVTLAPGAHEVVFDYRPVSVTAGLLTGGLAWAAVGLGLLLGRRERKRA